MGCSSGKMVQVEPTKGTTTDKSTTPKNGKDGVLQDKTDSNNNNDRLSKTDRMASASSKISERTYDSGLGDRDTESLSSISTTTTARTQKSGTILISNIFHIFHIFQLELYTK